MRQISALMEFIAHFFDRVLLSLLISVCSAMHSIQIYNRDLNDDMNQRLILRSKRVLHLCFA